MAEVRDLIRRILGGNFSEADLEDLILRLASILAPAARARQYRNIQAAGYEPRDVAFLALSSLFGRTVAGSFPVLEKTFLGPNNALNVLSDADFERYLRGVLSRRLKEAFFAISGEVRPERAKLRREFLLALKKGREKGLCEVAKDGGEIVFRFVPGPSTAQNLPVQTPPAPAQPHPPPHLRLSPEALLETAVSLRLWGLQVPKFLRRLADGLRLVPESAARSIRLRDAVEVYEKINSLDLTNQPPMAAPDFASSTSTPSSAPLREFLSSRLRDLDRENERLVASYVRRGKIPEAEGGPLLLAIRDIMGDYLDGGKEASLYSYWKRRSPGLDPASYRGEQRKILEYLFRRSKALIRDRAAAWRRESAK